MTARLQESKNYNAFELCNFNRNVRKVKRLRTSMEKHGWIDAYPMHCVRNGSHKLKVKGGHHRFVVARSLGIPVKYVLCDDDSTVHELEAATTSWTLQDFLESHVKCGRPAYIRVKDYHEKTGIPLNQCISMLSGHSASSGNRAQSFKDGTYKIGDTSHAYDVSRMVLACKDRDIPFAAKTLFVQALSYICRLPDFDYRTLLSRIDANPGLLDKQPSLAGYLDKLEQVYNRAAGEPTVCLWRF